MSLLTDAVFPLFCVIPSKAGMTVKKPFGRRYPTSAASDAACQIAVASVRPHGYDGFRIWRIVPRHVRPLSRRPDLRRAAMLLGLAASLVSAVALFVQPASAETPKRGGVLTYMIPADAPPSFDGHREST